MIQENYSELKHLFLDAPNLLNTRVDEYIYIVKEAQKRGFRVPGCIFKARFFGEEKTLKVFALIPGEAPEEIYDYSGFTKFFERVCKIVNELEPKIFAEKHLYSFNEIKEKGIEKLKDEAYVNYFNNNNEFGFEKFDIESEFNKNWKPREGENYRKSENILEESLKSLKEWETKKDK
jgi:hypothetical protein